MSSSRPSILTRLAADPQYFTHTLPCFTHSLLLCHRVTGFSTQPESWRRESTVRGSHSTSISLSYRRTSSPSADSPFHGEVTPTNLSALGRTWWPTLTWTLNGVTATNLYQHSVSHGESLSHGALYGVTPTNLYQHSVSHSESLSHGALYGVTPTNLYQHSVSHGESLSHGALYGVTPTNLYQHSVSHGESLSHGALYGVTPANLYQHSVTTLPWRANSHPSLSALCHAWWTAHTWWLALPWSTLWGNPDPSLSGLLSHIMTHSYVEHSLYIRTLSCMLTHSPM